jgi:hypothetical protein
MKRVGRQGMWPEVRENWRDGEETVRAVYTPLAYNPLAALLAGRSVAVSF